MCGWRDVEIQALAKSSSSKSYNATNIALVLRVIVFSWKNNVLKPYFLLAGKSCYLEPEMPIFLVYFWRRYKLLSAVYWHWGLWSAKKAAYFELPICIKDRGYSNRPWTRVNYQLLFSEPQFASTVDNTARARVSYCSPFHVSVIPFCGGGIMSRRHLPLPYTYSACLHFAFTLASPLYESKFDETKKLDILVFTWLLLCVYGRSNILVLEGIKQ